MDKKSEKALCPNKPREIKIGKTTYIVTANYKRIYPHKTKSSLLH